MKPQCFPGAGWRLQDCPLFMMLERQGFPDTQEQCVLLIQMIFIGAAWSPAGHWVGLAGPCCLPSGCWGTGSSVPQLAVAPPSSCFWAAELTYRGSVRLKNEVLVKQSGNLVMYSSSTEILWAVNMLKELVSVGGGARAPLQQWRQALFLWSRGER